MTKIGILGGTFDPVHNGHLRLGKQAYREYGLDQVWFMPSGRPPHKKDHTVTDAKHRCAMIRLAVREQEGLQLSEFEIGRPGTTYTAMTLELLRQSFPGYAFYFIVGADSLYEMETWYRPEQIFSLAKILAAWRECGEARRPFYEQIEYLQKKFGAWIRPLHCPAEDISSSRIRRMAGEGQSLTGLVPEAVADYITAHRLYQEVPA